MFISIEKSRGVCETLQYAPPPPPPATKLEKSFLSFKVKVKVTRSLTLESLERASLVDAKYEVSISYGSNVIAKVKVDNRQTDKKTDRQDKKNAPDHSIRGHKKRWALTLTSSEGFHKLSIHTWQMWSLYPLRIKSNGKGWSFCTTDRQAKTRCSHIPFWGHKNLEWNQSILSVTFIYIIT